MLMRFLVTPKNVRSMTSMGKMHSRKEWEAVVECMTHSTSSHPSSVGAHLEVRQFIIGLKCWFIFLWMHFQKSVC